MRVLVVADMKALADVVVKGLREAAMAVDVAYDKGEAACKLDINEYEVVIVDRALQGHDGDAVCRLVAESEHPTMILMLTAADAPEDTIAGLDLGADDCLAKPFHLRELVFACVPSRGDGRKHQARVLRTANVELDPLRHTVRRGDRPLALSGKEFGVLETLLRCDGAVLSAERLLERVWDEHADPFTNTVPVTISRLRRKLGNPPIIETVSGVGYRVHRRSDDSTSS